MINEFAYLGVLLLLTTVMVIMMGLAFTVYMRPRMKLKKRLKMIGTLSKGNNGVSAKAETRRQKRIQDKVKNIESENEEKPFTQQTQTLIQQAGLQIEVSGYITMSVIVGILAAGLYFAIGLPFPIAGAPAAGVIGAMGLPKLFLSVLAGRRQKAFTSHFAEAIDVIVRGVRSGLPVGETLNICSREFPGPVGEEFTMIVEGQRLGMTLDEIMARGLERMPTAEFKFFAIVLQIQKQTGGNLADTLENLSTVLRGRKQMKDKVKALSSEAKSSAAIIACLPFLVMGMLSVINPEYLMLLFTTKTGNYMVGAGAFWMMCGIALMAQMINFDI